MFSDNIYAERSLPSRFRHSWRVFYKDVPAMIGLYGFILLIFFCLFGGIMAPYSPTQQFLGYQLFPPSWSKHGDVSFFLGTDDLGRDLLSRLLNGTLPTVGSGILVTVLAIICAMVPGVLAGLTRGLRSAILKHLLDSLLSIPSFLLAIIVVALFGPRLEHTLFAVWLALLPGLAQSIYNAVYDEREKDYVIADKLDGASQFNLLRYSILPNILPRLVGEFTRTLSLAILEIASLGFLGLGARMPSSEWGRMLADALDLVYVAPWALMLPGAAIMLSVLIVNLLGNGIQRAISAEIE